jgi:copper chaperone CopZ
MKILKIKNTFAAVALLLMFSVQMSGQIKKAEIIATGLTCSMCSNAINKQLKSLPDVLNVETDLNTNTFTVTLADNNTISPKVFKDSVEKAGFFIGSLLIITTSTTILKSPYILVNKNGKIDGEVKVQVLDKGYVTNREYKKLLKSMKKIESYYLSNEDDFHIKVLD